MTGECKTMEKEAPRRPTKKKHEKESERDGAESRSSQTELPPESKSELFSTKLSNLPASAIRTKASRTKLGSQLTKETQKFSAVVVPQEQWQKPREVPASSQTSAERRLTPDQLECEADLYADIATLNSLMSNFERGNIDIATYKRQVQSLITDMLKCKTILEKTGISVQEFLSEEKIMEQYPLVYERFKALESDATLESFIESLSVTKADVASETAEFVTSLITLSDYAKLGGDMAKVESLIPIIEVLLEVLQDFPTTRKDYWGLQLLRNWHTKLSMLPADSVLAADEAKKLETDANRLLDDFKRRLREI
jgi:hypothetical protein